MREVLVATTTHEGKDYCLDKFAENFKRIKIPDDMKIYHIIVYNGPKDYIPKLQDKFPDALVTHQHREGMDIKEYLAKAYNGIFHLAEGRPLIVIESDVFPPENAIMVMWDYYKNHQKAKVVGCHCGMLPNNKDDDGSKFGFASYNCYDFLESGDQQYELVEALDTEKFEDERPRVYTLGRGIVVSNRIFMDSESKKGKVWYVGASDDKAHVEFTKAREEYAKPLKVHQIPVLPPKLQVKPDLEAPQRVYGFHFCCTLFAPEITRKYKLKYIANSEDYFDTFFYRELKDDDVEVWAVPLLCWHDHRSWDTKQILNDSECTQKPA